MMDLKGIFGHGQQRTIEETLLLMVLQNQAAMMYAINSLFVGNGMEKSASLEQLADKIMKSVEDMRK